VYVLQDAVKKKKSPKKALPVLGSTMDLVKKRSASVMELPLMAQATSSASKKSDVKVKKLPDIKESDESDKNNYGGIARPTFKKADLLNKKESDTTDDKKPTCDARLTEKKKADAMDKEYDRGEANKPSWAMKPNLRSTDKSKWLSQSGTKISDTEDDKSSGKPSWLKKSLTPVEKSRGAQQSRGKSDTESVKPAFTKPSWFKNKNTVASSNKPRGTQDTDISLCEDEQNSSEADSSDEETYYDIINHSDTDSNYL